jgi:tetratricopeptide (TPR) repeat protein
VAGTMLAAKALAIMIAASTAHGSAKQEREAEDMLGPGMRLIEAGDYVAGIKTLAKAIPPDCTNPVAFGMRASAYVNIPIPSDGDPIYVRLGDMADADFRRALELDPSYPGARNWVALNLRDKGQHLAAAREWRTVLREELKIPWERRAMQRNPVTWVECAEAYAEGGELDEGLKVLREYFSKHAYKNGVYQPQDTTPLTLMARLLLKKGKPDQALAYTRKAIRSRFTNLEDMRVHALVLEAAGQKEAALKAAAKLEEMGIEGDPEITALRERLGKPAK